MNLLLIKIFNCTYLNFKLHIELSDNMAISAQIIIAEDLEVIPTGNMGEMNKIVNPILKMRVPFIPAGLTFVVSIITTGIDFSKDNNFSIKIIDPSLEETDKNYILYTSGEGVIHANNNKTDNFNFNLNLKNIPFRREGSFKVIMNIEDQIFSQEFEVVADENLRM